METLRVRKSSYRRVLDLVQKYQAHYKKYPRAVLFFKDMKLIEWSYNRFGDLSYLSQEQRDDIGLANTQTSLYSLLLASTIIFHN